MCYAIILPACIGCSGADPGNVAEESQEEPSATFRLDSRPGQPTITDGTVYIGSQAGILHAVDMATAEELWRFETGGPVYHAPLVTGDLVLFGSWDGQLRAADKSNGELRWFFQAGEVDWEVRDIFINGIPTILDGVAYFSSEDFNVYAVEVETGREVWRYTLGEEPQARVIPIVDRTAYIGAWDGYLYAIDVDSGTLVWRSATDDRDRAALPDQVPFVTAVPIVTEGSVYFSDWAGNLFAVDRKTGEQQWRFDAKAADSRHVGSRGFIARRGDVIYFSTLEDHHLYGVDRHTGEAVWKKQTEGITYGPVPVGDGIALLFEVIEVAAGEEDKAYLRAMDLETREFLWSTGDRGSLPTVKDAVVYYVGADGTVHGRDLRTGDEVYRLGQ